MVVYRSGIQPSITGNPQWREAIPPWVSSSSPSTALSFVFQIEPRSNSWTEDNLNSIFWKTDKKATASKRASYFLPSSFCSYPKLWNSFLFQDLAYSGEKKKNPCRLSHEPQICHKPKFNWKKKKRKFATCNIIIIFLMSKLLHCA